MIDIEIYRGFSDYCRYIDVFFLGKKIAGFKIEEGIEEGSTEIKRY